MITVIFRQIVILGSLLPIIALANINSDLHRFFDRLGYSSNVTNPQVYHGQAAGLYTGGSIYARHGVRNIQIASVQLPSKRAGCSGIDLFTGGFSFINSHQLEMGLKNIANNSANYAFLLALKSVTSLSANTMEDLQSWANKINRMNINSCETGAALVGSLWPKTQVAQQNVCASIGTQSGIFGDWAAAKQGCGAGGQRGQVLNRGKNDPRYRDMIMDNTNIAWHALQKNGFLADDPTLAELFMSLSGTLIMTSQDHGNGSNHFTVLPSLAADRQLLKALLYGGQAHIYHCDETQHCLHPTVTTITVSQRDALGQRVRQLLNDMVTHIEEDTPLTAQEIGLLNATPLPLYKMLNVQAAYVGDPDLMDLSQYTHVIASSILFQYINESLAVVKQSASALQDPQPMLTTFVRGMNEAKAAISEEKHQAYQTLNQTITLIERTQTLERQLAGDLSVKMAGNLRWANAMR